MTRSARHFSFPHQRHCLSFVSVCTVVVVLAVLGQAQETFPVPVPTWNFQPQSGMDQPYVLDWKVIGPFDWTEAPVPAKAVEHSDVIARQLDYPFLPEFEAENEASYNPQVPGIITRMVTTTNGLVRLHRVLPKYRYEVAYAECSVISDSEQDAILLPESDDGIKIWVNGVVVARVNAIRRIAQFEGYVRMHLRRGPNHVVVKIARTRQTDIWDPWDFAVGFRSSEGTLDEIAGRGVPHFFPNIVIRINDPLTVDLSLFPAGEKVTLTLKQNEKRQEWTLTGGAVSKVDLKGYVPGPIETTLKSGHHRFSEPILCGEAEVFAERYRTLLPKYFTDARHNANLGSLLIRFEHLLEPSYVEHDSQLWQKKIAELSWQIEKILADVTSGREPYRGKAGTWLRGFQSGVDGAEQHYIVHAPPEAVQGQPFPLVIIVPYEELPLRPFLYSIRVAEYSVLKLLDRAADRNGFGYLWADNRGNTYGQEFGQAELFEALAEVKRDYTIDPKRIYLFGVCSGGLHALSLAADHPDLFAAIGTMTPVAQYRLVTIFDPPRPTDAYACEALHSRSPVQRMANLMNVPIMVVHGDDDSHNAISESEELSTAAHANGVPFTFIIEHGGTELRFPRDPRYTIFDFFRGKVLPAHPSHIIYTARSARQRQSYWLRIDALVDPLKSAQIEGELSQENISVHSRNVASFSILLDRIDLDRKRKVVVRTNGIVSYLGHPTTQALSIKAEDIDLYSQHATTPRPVSDAFASPFLVVIGTRGARALEAKEQASEFLNTWRERFFTTARSKDDIDVNDRDLRDYNLILFGTTESNSILARIAPSLPFRYSEAEISLGGQSWLGQTYSIQASFPNPLNSDHLVIMAGNPECKKCFTDAMQFTLHGWYDAAIWKQNDDGYVQMVDVGFFDRSGQRFVSAPACH